MDYKILILLSLVLIFAISGLRKRLITEIKASSLLVFGSARLGTWVYSLIFLPGTILHEFSHWLTAEILLVPTGKFEIMPDLSPDGGEERLGYVMTGKTGPLKGFLIGFAPLFVGVMVLILLGYYLNQILGLAPLWHLLLVLYAMVVVGNSMMVSQADRRNWPIIAIIAALLVFATWRLNIRFTWDLNHVVNPIVIRINQALGLTFALNLGMISLLYVIRRIIERVVKKKIVIGR